jgi:hypothetical protein
MSLSTTQVQATGILWTCEAIMADAGPPDAGVDVGQPPSPPPVDDGGTGGNLSPSPSETRAAVWAALQHLRVGESALTSVRGSSMLEDMEVESQQA